MKNKIISLIAICAILAAAFTNCGTDQPTSVSEVRFDADTMDLLVGYTSTLNATVLPESAVNKELIWGSSNDAIAAVGIDGVVMGVSVGTATISAVSVDGQKTASCTVNVSSNSATSITLDKEMVYLSLAEGDKAVITATVLPEQATDKSVVWQSRNTSVARVADGVVTAVGEGSTKIIAITTDGGLMAECNVTVDWLGGASFYSDKTWTVGEQTWSDVVIATGCYKEEYDGGKYGETFKPACRMNLERYYGDLFSWEAVYQFRDRICPDGWRVPTNQEFMQLDLALGGTGGLQGDIMQVGRYFETWGAQYGGVADGESAGALANQGLCATYWSQTEYDASNGRRLVFCNGGEIDPNNYAGKDYGMTVRCIKE